MEPVICYQISVCGFKINILEGSFKLYLNISNTGLHAELGVGGEIKFF